MKEKKIDEKPKKGRMIMWAFIYSGVFIAALIIGVVSKFVQPSWTKDFTAEWGDFLFSALRFQAVRIDVPGSASSSLRRDCQPSRRSCCVSGFCRNRTI